MRGLPKPERRRLIALDETKVKVDNSIIGLQEQAKKVLAFRCSFTSLMLKYS